MLNPALWISHTTLEQSPCLTSSDPFSGTDVSEESPRGSFSVDTRRHWVLESMSIGEALSGSGGGRTCTGFKNTRNSKVNCSTLAGTELPASLACLFESCNLARRCVTCPAWALLARKTFQTGEVVATLCSRLAPVFFGHNARVRPHQAMVQNPAPFRQPALIGSRVKALGTRCHAMISTMTFHQVQSTTERPRDLSTGTVVQRHERRLSPQRCTTLLQHRCGRNRLMFPRQSSR